MKDPVMSFVAEVAGNILEASKPIEPTTVFEVVGMALKHLPKSPVSIDTGRFFHNGCDCLAKIFDGHYVGYSIRDEVVKVIVIKEKRN